MPLMIAASLSCCPDVRYSISSKGQSLDWIKHSSALSLSPFRIASSPSQRNTAASIGCGSSSQPQAPPPLRRFIVGPHSVMMHLAGGDHAGVSVACLKLPPEVSDWPPVSPWKLEKSTRKSAAFGCARARPTGMGNSVSAREAFDQMDTDKSGELDFDEIMAAVKAMGQDPSEEKIHQYIKDHDADGNGRLDFAEFEGLAAQVAGGDSAPEEPPVSRRPRPAAAEPPPAPAPAHAAPRRRPRRPRPSPSRRPRPRRPSTRPRSSRTSSRATRGRPHAPSTCSAWTAARTTTSRSSCASRRRTRATRAARRTRRCTTGSTRSASSARRCGSTRATPRRPTGTRTRRCSSSASGAPAEAEGHERRRAEARTPMAQRTARSVLRARDRRGDARRVARRHQRLGIPRPRGMRGPRARPPLDLA